MKKVRNKTRDTLADYWRTNRATEKANEEALQNQEGESKQEEGSKKAEKVMAIVIVIGVVGIIIRTIFF